MKQHKNSIENTNPKYEQILLTFYEVIMLNILNREY
jgi:hypothetical protein